MTKIIDILHTHIREKKRRKKKEEKTSPNAKYMQ